MMTSKEALCLGINCTKSERQGNIRVHFVICNQFTVLKLDLKCQKKNILQQKILKKENQEKWIKLRTF